jgi:hypothetical protein
MKEKIIRKRYGNVMISERLNPECDAPADTILFLQKAASGCATNVQSSAFLGTRLAHMKQTSMLARANQAVSCHVA